MFDTPLQGDRRQLRAGRPPSVSSCKRSSSSPVRQMSYSARNSDISAGAKLRSSPRSSSRSPRRRSRASDSGGSDRVAAANRKPSGNASVNAVSNAGSGAAR